MRTARAQLRMLKIAQEWALELGKIKGHEAIVCAETMTGFEEVDKGRNPDVVLREVLAKIEERINANRPNVSMH